jgi:signal transduction histidine kinase
VQSALERAKAIYRRHGPLVRDVTAVALGVVFTLLAAKTPWSPMSRPVILLAGSIGSVALWWRRRWPAGTTLVGIAAFLLSANPWPLGVGLFTTASRRRDRVLVAVTATASVGFSVPVMIDLGRFDLQALVAGVAEAGFVAAAGSYVGTRQDLLASLRDRAERAEAERELRDEQTKAGERARIAREMHDVLAHKVSLIALQAGGLEVNPGADASRIEDAAGLIRSTARQALEELRSVLGVLRSDTRGDGDRVGDGLDDLAPLPQAADIRRLVDASRAAGVPAELRDELPDLPDATARAAYRVVQEGLTNVHKHAPGAATVVSVSGDEQVGVIVAVTNRPPAATGPMLPGSGAGLVGLRERMRLAGGTLRSGPEPDGGWRLESWLPWTTVPPDGPAPGPEVDPNPGPRLDEPSTT